MSMLMRLFVLLLCASVASPAALAQTVPKEHQAWRLCSRVSGDAEHLCQALAMRALLYKYRAPFKRPCEGTSGWVQMTCGAIVTGNPEACHKSNTAQSARKGCEAIVLDAIQNESAATNRCDGSMDTRPGVETWGSAMCYSVLQGNADKCEVVNYGKQPELKAVCQGLAKIKSAISDVKASGGGSGGGGW